MACTPPSGRFTSCSNARRNGGVPTERIVLAGFSQGGAMALHTALRYPDQLARHFGLVLPSLASQLNGERGPANRQTPIFMAHGDYDAIIPLRYGRQSAELLESLAYQVEWQDYGMGHEACWQEIQDIAGWLGRILAVSRA